MELVTSKDEIVENLALFDGYRNSDNIKYRHYVSDRLRLGKIFVYGVVGDRWFFAPSRFAGYRQCTIEKHEAFPDKDGRITTPQISKLLGVAKTDDMAEAAYRRLCMNMGIDPADKERTYWKIDLSSNVLNVLVSSGEPGFPDEVMEYVEGATTRVVVNAYERNVKARAICLDHHGYSCCVCTFNFEAHFGKIGQGFMHVHHLTPISKHKTEYVIDPIIDLRPVCPNCHAMLHKSDPPFSIGELKELIDTVKKKIL